MPLNHQVDEALARAIVANDVELGDNRLHVDPRAEGYERARKQSHDARVGSHSARTYTASRWVM